MSPAALAAFGGATAAVLSLLLAAASGGPYLTAERVNGWLVVFASALLVLLTATPFVLERWLRERRRGELRDERWEAAALAWGALTVCALAVAIPIGLAESFSGDSLAGSAALVVTIESGLVLGTLVAWLLAG